MVVAMGRWQTPLLARSSVASASIVIISRHTHVVPHPDLNSHWLY